MEESAVNWTEWAVKRVFFWEEDETKVGKLVRAIHAGFTYIVLMLIVLSFTLIPAFWFQTVLLCIAGAVWAQHILFHGCVFSKVEQRLLKDETSFLDPYLDLFGVEATERSKQGILMMLSTVGVTMFTLAWGGRLMREIVPLLTAQVRAAAPGLHIPPPLSSLSGSPALS
jgi:hypothetical protein